MSSGIACITVYLITSILLMADYHFKPIEELRFFSDVRFTPRHGELPAPLSPNLKINEGVFTERHEFAKNESLVISRNEVTINTSGETFRIPIEKFDVLKVGKDVSLNEHLQVQLSRKSNSRILIIIFKHVNDLNKTVSMIVKYELLDLEVAK